MGDRMVWVGLMSKIRATKTHELQMALKGINFFLDLSEHWGVATFYCDDLEIGDFVNLVYSSGSQPYIVSDVEFFFDGICTAKFLKVQQN
ncbi:MAG: hypothetical protein ACRCYP_02105 [Alphaproteobacteria bacterium]